MADRRERSSDRRGPNEAAGESGPESRIEQPEDPLRRRLRTSLGLSERQWPHVLNLAIVTPYPVFIAGYLFLPVPEFAFLAVTLVYSLVAMYVGFRL